MTNDQKQKSECAFEYLLKAADINMPPIKFVDCTGSQRTENKQNKVKST